MTARLIAGCTIAALWQAAGHWQPLSESYKRPSVPRRLFAYVYGVLGILLGLAVATDGATAAPARMSHSADDTPRSERAR